MDFQLDTSGAIADIPQRGETPKSVAIRRGQTTWSDLSPFAQGYVEALLKDAVRGRYADEIGKMWLTFSDLAPETLARIIADCEYVQSVERFHDRHVNYSADEGAALWRKRQSPLSAGTPEPAYGLPPLTVQLGDDGRVRFAA